MLHSFAQKTPTIGAVLIFLFSLALRAQGQDDIKADSYEVLLKGIHATLSSTFQGQKINVLAAPVVLKNVIDVPNGPTEDLVVFDRVPKRSTFRFEPVPGDEGIVNRLKLLIPGVKIGTIVLSDLDTAALKKAKQVLYQDDETRKPKPAYRKYQDLSAKIRKIDQRLKDPADIPSQAEKNALLFERREISQEWNKPWRFPVEEALDVLMKLGAQIDVRDQFKEWKDSLTQPATGGNYNELWESLSAQDGWVAVTFPLKVEQGLGIGDPAKKNSVAFANSKVLSVSMRIARIPIARPALAHSFLSARAWTNNKWVVSKGNPKQDVDDELVPRYASHLIVAREIEIDFPDVKSWKSAAEVLRGAEKTVIGGMTVTRENLFLSPKHITILRPQVIGVVIADMFLCPNPDPRLKF